MGGDQRDGGLGPEIDIGLVDHHRHVGCSSSRSPAISARDRATPVGALGLATMIGPPPPIIGGADVHRLVERYDLMGDAEQPAIDRIEAVGDVREPQWPVVLQQRGGRSPDLVGAVADEYLFGAHP